MSALGPLDHLARTPLPWRGAEDYTECGRLISDIGPERIITRAQLKTRINELGQKRAAFETCMTCVDTANRWPDDPLEVLHREVTAVHHLHQWTPHPQYWTRRPEGERQRYDRDRARYLRFVREYEAITALIEAHREEFDSFVEDVEGTVSLADRRAKRKADEHVKKHPRGNWVPR
jgi:hypothetical protein